MHQRCGHLPFSDGQRWAQAAKLVQDRDAWGGLFNVLEGLQRTYPVWGVTVGLVAELGFGLLGHVMSIFEWCGPGFRFMEWLSALSSTLLLNCIYTMGLVASWIIAYICAWWDQSFGASYYLCYYCCERHSMAYMYLLVFKLSQIYCVFSKQHCLMLVLPDCRNIRQVILCANCLETLFFKFEPITNWPPNTLNCEHGIVARQ